MTNDSHESRGTDSGHLPADVHEMNEQGRASWDAKATFWDNLHGDDGNYFHQRLISPAVERLLNLQPGERVLDIACGSGVLARRMAELGANVTAVDFSAALIERAMARKQRGGPPIQYDVADATNSQALIALGKGQFDAITCTMAIMDMPTLSPMYRAVAQLLAPLGRFVFATMHPAFNSNNPVFVGEQADVGGKITETLSLKLTYYMDMPPVIGAGAPGEPNPHPYYHRPLHTILGDAFDCGLILDGLEESAAPAEDHDSARLLTWRNLHQFPPVMAGRLRLCPRELKT